MGLNSQMGQGTLWQSVPCKLLSRRGFLNCISLSSAAMRRSLRQANFGKEERSTQFKVLNGPEHCSAQMRTSEQMVLQYNGRGVGQDQDNILEVPLLLIPPLRRPSYHKPLGDKLYANTTGSIPQLLPAHFHPGRIVKNY